MKLVVLVFVVFSCALVNGNEENENVMSNADIDKMMEILKNMNNLQDARYFEFNKIEFWNQIYLAFQVLLGITTPVPTTVKTTTTGGNTATVPVATTTLAGNTATTVGSTATTAGNTATTAGNTATTAGNTATTAADTVTTAGNTATTISGGGLGR